ncbi:MAG: hypothetical protein ACRETA_11465 [Gammaproteobacteria bacterium]
MKLLKMTLWLICSYASDNSPLPTTTSSGDKLRAPSIQCTKPVCGLYSEAMAFMEFVFSFGDFSLQHLKHGNVLILFDERQQYCL